MLECLKRNLGALPTTTFLWGASVALLVACSAFEEGSLSPQGNSPLTAPCDPGFVLSEDGQVCVETGTRCAPGEAKSIADICDGLGRVCIQEDRQARCGPCQATLELRAGECLPPKTCADLQCGTIGRRCNPETEEQSAACGSCAQGLMEIVATGVCVRPNCDLGDAPGSMAQPCADNFRTCVPNEQGVFCGECWPGYVLDGFACRPARSCQDLGCVLDGYRCEAATADQDARCGGCLVGWTPNEEGTCSPMVTDQCSDVPEGQEMALADICLQNTQECVLEAGDAQCGPCQIGSILNADTGACIAALRCAELSCAAENRNCSNEPAGHCTSCLPGFVEDPALEECRPVKTCNDLECMVTEDCVDHTDYSDALCTSACGENEIWGGRRCEPCPSCDGLGEAGRWPWPSATGACICQTEPGYFYSTSADIGTFACDGDGDGWLRESARNFVHSRDPVLQENARCQEARIDRFVLRNEAGEEWVELLDTPLALYETVRNDDDAILAATWRAQNAPVYGVNGARLQARYLNRLTKLCHALGADYNDNGVADVDEYGNQTLSPSLLPEQAPFNRFAYFMALHQGHHELPGPGKKYGRFVIEERARLGAPAQDNLGASIETTAPNASLDPIPLRYENAKDYWRQCTVRRDPAYLEHPVGKDFAEFFEDADGDDLDDRALPGSPWRGMRHHSQFQCLLIDDEPDPNTTHITTPAVLAAAGHGLSQCRLFPEGTEDASIVCTALQAQNLNLGQAVWAVRPFLDHGPDAQNAPYRGGCINECIEGLSQCPGFDINPAAVRCEYASDNFGKQTDCFAWEVCDGFDNDANGAVDDGNPGGGDACQSSGLGRCQAGTKNCVQGSVACIPDQASAPETCNGQDDDCDGAIDDGNPGGGIRACTVTSEKGQCRIGRLHCENGSLSACRSVSGPVAESCNGLDDDCDGEIDEPPEGTCRAPWRLYYFDSDNDSYGTASKEPQCRCSASGKYRARRAGDCCDSDSRARPGATTWRTSANRCSSFDWNCNGVENKRYTSAGSSGCGTGCSGFCCASSGSGWANNIVPPCGVQADIYNGCGGWSSCPQHTKKRTQECR